MATVKNSTVSFIARWEGFSEKAYWDYSQYSIGFGSGVMPDGRPVKPGDKITYSEAYELLRKLVLDYGSFVNSVVTKNINQNQFDALTSLCYNIGKSAFANSTVLKRVNANPQDMEGIEAGFKMWNKAGGSINQGLVKRRQAEANLYKRSVAGGSFFFLVVLAVIVFRLAKR